MRYLLQAPDFANTDFFSGPPLAALTALSFSENINLQRKAVLAFAEITEKEVRHVGPEALDPIFRLLDSRDPGVQEAACVALKNFAINGGYFRCSVTPYSEPILRRRQPASDRQPRRLGTSYKSNAKSGYRCSMQGDTLYIGAC